MATVPQRRAAVTGKTTTQTCQSQENTVRSSEVRGRMGNKGRHRHLPLDHGAAAGRFAESLLASLAASVNKSRCKHEGRKRTIDNVARVRGNPARYVCMQHGGPEWYNGVGGGTNTTHGCTRVAENITHRHDTRLRDEGKQCVEVWVTTTCHNDKNKVTDFCERVTDPEAKIPSRR